VTVELPGTRDDILEYLQERAFSSVPVVKPSEDGEQYRGLISRDDLIERPEEDQLAMLMRDAPTTTTDATIQEVAALMLREDARRVPVVEDGRLEGIVTVTDVVRAIADGEEDGDTEVGGLARRDVNTTYAGTPLTVTEREISFANVPYSVVLGEDGEMAGIVTEVDVIEVARVVEGEANTGDSIADDDDDWKWGVHQGDREPLPPDAERRDSRRTRRGVHDSRRADGVEAPHRSRGGPADADQRRRTGAADVRRRTRRHRPGRRPARGVADE